MHALTKKNTAVEGNEDEDDDDGWEDCTDSEEEEDYLWRIGLVEAPKIPEALNPEYFPSKVNVCVQDIFQTRAA